MTPLLVQLPAEGIHAASWVPPALIWAVVWGVILWHAFTGRD